MADEDDEREHYLSIHPNLLTRRHPDCGCELERGSDGRVRYYQCKMHDAASEFLAALKAIRSGMADDRAYRDAARKAIAKAGVK